MKKIEILFCLLLAKLFLFSFCKGSSRNSYSHQSAGSKYEEVILEGPLYSKTGLCLGSQLMRSGQEVLGFSSCTGDETQHWKMLSTGQFVQKNSGLCISCCGRGESLTKICTCLLILTNCQNMDTQTWTTNQTQNSYFMQFINVEYNKCLENDNELAVLVGCNVSQHNQLFSFNTSPPPSLSLHSSSYNEVPIKSKSSGQCLDTINNTPNYKILGFNDCDSENKEQQWIYVEDYKQIKQVSSGLCISTGKNYTTLIVTKCDDYLENQEWDQENCKDNFCEYSNWKFNNYCMSQDGENALLQQCDEKGNQYFSYVPDVPAPDPPFFGNAPPAFIIGFFTIFGVLLFGIPLSCAVAALVAYCKIVSRRKQQQRNKVSHHDVGEYLLRQGNSSDHDSGERQDIESNDIQQNIEEQNQVSRHDGEEYLSRQGSSSNHDYGDNQSNDIQENIQEQNQVNHHDAGQCLLSQGNSSDHDSGERQDIEQNDFQENIEEQNQGAQRVVQNSPISTDDRQIDSNVQEDAPFRPPPNSLQELMYVFQNVQEISICKDIEIDWEDVLGSGQFGKVYKGKVTEQGKEKQGINAEYVAVKVLTEEYKTPTELKKILEEVVLMSKLNNEFIVQFYGVGPYFIPCIIMEHVPFGSLHDLLSQKYESYKTNLPWILELLIKITKGLEYLHSQNIVHHDLKPQNILVGFQDEYSDALTVKISDFGLSKIKEGSKTSSGGNKGTFNYMAPEQFYNKRTNQIDIWALGCIMQECLTGEEPWKGMDPAVIIYSLTNGSSPELPNLKGICQNDELYQLILKCWDYDKEEKKGNRPTASEIVLELERIKDIIQNQNQN